MARMHTINAFSPKNYYDLLNLYSSSFLVNNAVTDLMSSRLTKARSIEPIKIKITSMTAIDTCGFIK